MIKSDFDRRMTWWTLRGDILGMFIAVIYSKTTILMGTDDVIEHAKDALRAVEDRIIGNRNLESRMSKEDALALITAACRRCLEMANQPVEPQPKDDR